MFSFPVCDLMSQLSLSNLNVGRAHYWCEKGAEHFPNNPIISRLRQKIIITEDTDPKALENFYLCKYDLSFPAENHKTQTNLKQK